MLPLLKETKMNITRINGRNQLNIPKEVAEKVNFGPERYVQVVVDHNIIHIIPITPEPLYSKTALEGLDHIVAQEKDQAVPVRGTEQVRQLFKRS